MAGMADTVKVELGAVQETLFIPLAARARETRRRQEAAVTRPPPELRSRLPRRYRYALPLANRIVGDLAIVTIFRASSR